MARAEWPAFISTVQWMARYKFEVQAKHITARCRPPHCASMENAFARRCPTRLCNRASILSASVPTPSGGRSLGLVLRIVISRGLKNASCAVGANIDHSRKLLTSSDVTTHEVLDVRLVSYGPSQTDNYRQVGNYVGRILKDPPIYGHPILESRVDHQSQDRQGARYNRPIAAAWPRRRGDPIRLLYAQKTQSLLRLPHCCSYIQVVSRAPQANELVSNFPRFARTFSASLRAPSYSCKAPVAQLDRAPDFESGGQGFESLPARQQLFESDSEFLRDFLPVDSRILGAAPGQHATSFQLHLILDREKSSIVWGQLFGHRGTAGLLSQWLRS